MREAIFKYLNRSVFYYLSGTFINNIGNGVFTLITSKIIYDQTNSVSMIGLLIIIQNVIAGTLNLVAGHIADKFNSKYIAIFADLIQAVAVLTSLLLINSEYRLLSLLLAMIFINLAAPFFRAANFKNVSEIKRGRLALGSLNAVRSSLNQGGQLIGVAIATPFIYYKWYFGALLLNILSFIVSAVCTSQIEIISLNEEKIIPKSKTSNLITDWKIFLETLWRQWPILIILIFTIFDYLAVNVVNLMEIKYSVKILHNVAWMSIMDGCFAVGSVLSFVLVNRLSQHLSFKALIWIGLFIQGLGFTVLSQANNVGLTLVVMWVIGLFNGTSITLFQTSLQLNLNVAIHGKISGFRDLLVSLSMIALIPLFSKLIDRSVLTGLLSLGLILILVAIVLVIIARLPKFKRIRLKEE
ncbi:MFS transporter [Lactobacillus sp. DCY120]|uniref:MFS transporter n=1 Tax=Bombilactobacillus apium TaxID=2675299 RepID=A0A850R1E2_9LACO|nr:MFS transporter [Bombilactobacillus apium]NVY96743.1 MFS transporter [Bombilactobacillus apium]